MNAPRFGQFGALLLAALALCVPVLHPRADAVAQTATSQTSSRTGAYPTIVQAPPMQVGDSSASAHQPAPSRMGEKLAQSGAGPAAPPVSPATPADAAAGGAKPAAPARSERFSFAVMADTPYRVPQDFPRFDRLIDAIAASKPAFSVHLGGIMSAHEPCTDEYYRSILRRFVKLGHPLIYTPGDNEWLNCHLERAGKFDPRERLNKLREVFFPDPTRSIGDNHMVVEPQSAVLPARSAYVENVRFWRNNVLFVAVHVVGMNNGFEPSSKESIEEYFARNRANVTWIDDSFRLAREKGAIAVVLLTHASLFDLRQKSPVMPAASGYGDTVRAIERGMRVFGKPLLLVHGSGHEFEFEGLRGADYKRIPNAWRLQVMGDTHAHGVMITVDPHSSGVFSFGPLVVPENGPP